jgi:hypothetical protein
MACTNREKLLFVCHGWFVSAAYKDMIRVTCKKRDEASSAANGGSLKWIDVRSVST